MSDPDDLETIEFEPGDNPMSRLFDLSTFLGHVCPASTAVYLTELLRHAKELKQKPPEWMPWNYRQTITRMLAA